MLSSYTYSVIYKSGKNQGNTDALSWLPFPEFLVLTPVPHFQEVCELVVWTATFQMLPSISQSDLRGVHQVFDRQWSSKGCPHS